MGTSTLRAGPGELSDASDREQQADAAAEHADELGGGARRGATTLRHRTLYAFESAAWPPWPATAPDEAEFALLMEKYEAKKMSQLMQSKLI